MVKNFACHLSDAVVVGGVIHDAHLDHHSLKTKVDGQNQKKPESRIRSPPRRKSQLLTRTNIIVGNGRCTFFYQILHTNREGTFLFILHLYDALIDAKEC